MPSGHPGNYTSLTDVTDGWHELGLLAVSVDDPRLTWPEREMVAQLGRKLYGPRAGEGGRSHG